MYLGLSTSTVQLHRGWERNPCTFFAQVHCFILSTVLLGILCWGFIKVTGWKENRSQTHCHPEWKSSLQWLPSGSHIQILLSLIIMLEGGFFIWMNHSVTECVFLFPFIKQKTKCYMMDNMVIILKHIKYNNLHVLSDKFSFYTVTQPWI